MDRIFKSYDSSPGFTPHEGSICATVTCNCRLGNMPMLIPSQQIVVTCKLCGCGYRIIKAAFDFAAGHAWPEVTVGQLPHMAVPQMQVAVGSGN